MRAVSLVVGLVFATTLERSSLAEAQAGVAPAAPVAEVEPEGAAAPAPEVQAQYRDVVARAVSEFDAGRWIEARALFLRAHELWPSARTLRTLGMTSFELRTYAQAMRELQAALDDPRRPLPEDQRAQVRALIDQAQAFVGRYRVQLAPSDAQLLVDGAPFAFAKDSVLLLEVGRHELRARAPAHSELARKLDVRGGEDETLALELSREAPPVATAPAPLLAPAAAASRAASDENGGLLFTWIAGGTAVALAGSSLALWLMSDAKFDAQKKNCEIMPGGGCQRGTVETAGIQDLQTAHQVTAVLAGVAGAAAVVLFFVEGGGGENAQLAFGPNGAVARGRF